MTFHNANGCSGNGFCLRFASFQVFQLQDAEHGESDAIHVRITACSHTSIYANVLRDTKFYNIHFSFDLGLQIESRAEY